MHFRSTTPNMLWHTAEEGGLVCTDSSGPMSVLILVLSTFSTLGQFRNVFVHPNQILFNRGGTTGERGPGANTISWVDGFG